MFSWGILHMALYVAEGLGRTSPSQLFSSFFITLIIYQIFKKSSWVKRIFNFNYSNFLTSLIYNKKVTSNKNEAVKEIKNHRKSNIFNLSNKLTKLGELKEKGLLTEDEFNEQKRKLL